jgi:acetylornithine deacetylase/succinyl-diaminopimelate desuccinylase-like protein
MSNATQAALTALDAQFSETLDSLKSLVAIPGVSAEGPDSPALATSAEAIADVMREAGLEQVEVLPHPGAPPYVMGEWCHATNAPTLLIYGHHDVQPAPNPERWVSPPWVADERGGRLYGRGVADDKAGVMSHLAAVRAWLSTQGSLPVNVKFIIEGEEEIGSPRLADFLASQKERLAADCLVLTDTCNLDTGIPALTTSLRGLIMADITVESLSGPLHSGIWGGALPDPLQALAKILARLSDDRGQVTIPGIESSDSDHDAYAALPFDPDDFRAQAGLVDGVSSLTDGGADTYAAMWQQPCVTVSAIDAVSIADSSNQIVPKASARVGVRLSPTQDADTGLQALVSFLQDKPPFGCKITVTPDCAAGGWQTDPKGPYFEAAARALEAGYGHRAVHIGCGGSIPFVEPFANAMGGIPALLLGVEDPNCHAHGENESLHLGDFLKACKSAVHLLAELADAPT